MQQIHLNAAGRKYLRQSRELAQANEELFSGSDLRLHILQDTLAVQGLMAEFCDNRVPCQRFREVVAELAYLLMANSCTLNGGVEIECSVTNPLGTKIKYHRPDHHRNIALAIQRAGVFMLPGLWRVQRQVEMYFPWLARDHQTLKAKWKQKHLPPPCLKQREDVSISLVDVVCAVGDSELKVLDELNKRGYSDEKITIYNLMAAREGIANVLKAHPKVNIQIAALSKFWLTNIGYIKDGPGDAGDRCCGTV